MGISQVQHKNKLTCERRQLWRNQLMTGLLDDIKAMAHLREAQGGKWSAIKPEYAARMRAQNRFHTRKKKRKKEKGGKKKTKCDKEKRKKKKKASKKQKEEGVDERRGKHHRQR